MNLDCLLSDLCLFQYCNVLNRTIYFSIFTGDALSYHRNLPFSTSDNDKTRPKCAMLRLGGWWYNRCMKSDLNAQYGNTSNWSGIIWDEWKGPRSLKATQIKIRPTDYISGIAYTSYYKITVIQQLMSHVDLCVR